MDAEVSVSVLQRDEIDAFRASIETDAQQALIASSKEGARLSAEFAPKRSGMLAQSISPIIAGLNFGGWTVKMPYWAPQDLGARPHVIGADGQILGNKADGFGPVRGPVWHPGNPATRFLERAFSLVMANILSRMKRSVA